MRLLDFLKPILEMCNRPLTTPSVPLLVLSVKRGHGRRETFGPGLHGKLVLCVGVIQAFVLFCRLCCGSRFNRRKSRQGNGCNDEQRW